MHAPSRVLFVLPTLVGGGAERVVLNVLRHLDPNRFAPTLFVLKREGVYWDEVPPSVAVHTGLSDGGRLSRNLPALLRQVVAHAARCDLLVGALELDATYLAYAAARLTRRPVAGWVHTPLDRYLDGSAPVHRVVAPRVYRRLDAVVVPGAGVAESLRRVTGGAGPDVWTVPNLLDTRRVSAAAREPVPEPLASVFRKPAVVAVGRLSAAKGFDVLVRSHALLRQRGFDHHLLILGEGSGREELERLVDGLQVRDSVFLPGFAPNPFPMIRAARVFVSASRFEGFGMAIVEALSLGVPVVATDCPTGPAEILDGGRYGALVPMEDPEALARAVAPFLHEADRVTALAEGGVERASHFAPAAVAAEWERFLAVLTARRRRPSAA